MTTRVLVHCPQTRQSVIDSAVEQGFSYTILGGNSAVKIISDDQKKLYDWCSTFDGNPQVEILYYDPSHPSNASVKVSHHLATNLVDLSPTDLPPPITPIPSVNYWYSGFYLTSVASALYRFPPPVSNARPNIGIISLGGGLYPGGAAAPTDPPLYWNALGLTNPIIPTLTVNLIDGYTNTPGIDANADVENVLDIEVVGGNCPNANISFYIGSGTTLATIYDIFNAAITDPVENSVISVSWSFSPITLAINSLFNLAASKGINMCCATGDFGSQGPYFNSNAFPAVSPSVIACGGTYLSSPTLSYYASTTTETSWSGTTGGGSAGGVTQNYQIPTYQQGIVNNMNYTGTPMGRCIPDISANASPSTGYVLIKNGAYYGLVGGTSAAAPAIAALLGILGVKTFMNPIFYGNLNSDIKGWYHYIVGGDNGSYLCPGGKYNMVTGLGSLDGLLLQKLCKSLGII